MSTYMLDVLHLVEQMLPNLLNDVSAESGWKSKCIDYSPPTTHRMYRDLVIGDGIKYRLYLHRIFPCERAFFHPHPWASAVRVLPFFTDVGGTGTSTYEMQIGYGSNERHDPPPVAATTRVQLSTGQSFSYSMEDIDGWHSVRISGEPSVSVMVSASPWDRVGGAPRTDKYSFRELTEGERSMILLSVKSHYHLPLPTKF